MHAKSSKMPGLLLVLTLLVPPAIALSQTTSSDSSSGSRSAAEPYNVAPDNSGRNVRDRSSHATTPFAQSNSQSDVDTTRRIRRALMDDKSLSTTARNVKVVTVSGTVFLRGPVKSQHEKAAITDKAQQIAGAGHVNDQLEIAGR
ncbi:MAG TPA: BON domain-containing protein [Candidatus Sulfotelmatobacter sp.]|nr:BON domain-containing protein [Candidatus Sulfotelmatobacter sp.]